MCETVRPSGADGGCTAQITQILSNSASRETNFAPEIVRTTSNNYLRRTPPSRRRQCTNQSIAMLHTKRSLRATRLLLTVLLSIPSLAVSAAGTDTIAFICTVADSMAIYTGTTFTTGTTYDMQNYPLRKGDVVVSFATDSATAAPSWESGNINFCNPSSGSHGNRLTIKSAEGKTLRLAGVRFTFEIDATPTSTTGWFESGSCTLTTSSSYAAAVWVPETGSTPDSVCFWNDNHTGARGKSELSGCSALRRLLPYSPSVLLRMICRRATKSRLLKTAWAIV